MTEAFGVLIFNPGSCTGCRICEMACSFFHYKEYNPARSRIKVLKDEKDGIYIPMACLHCGNPPCVDACPTGAMYRSDGSVELNLKKCINCKMCMIACPFGAISIDRATMNVIKCDLCGGDPQCAKYCPSGAIKYVRAERVGEIKRRSYADRTAHVISLSQSKGW
jgi:Fe-S-cluster-containing hydrogenase component 2